MGIGREIPGNHSIIAQCSRWDKQEKGFWGVSRELSGSKRENVNYFKLWVDKQKGRLYTVKKIGLHFRREQELFVWNETRRPA